MLNPTSISYQLIRPCHSIPSRWKSSIIVPSSTLLSLPSWLVSMLWTDYKLNVYCMIISLTGGGSMPSIASRKWGCCHDSVMELARPLKRISSLKSLCVCSSSQFIFWRSSWIGRLLRPCRWEDITRCGGGGGVRCWWGGVGVVDLLIIVEAYEQLESRFLMRRTVGGWQYRASRRCPSDGVWRSHNRNGSA